MVIHRDFSAWIVSEGKELEEFKPEVEGDDGRTMTCWVPSELGKKFEIHWKDINGGVATRGNVEVDGNEVDNRIISGVEGENISLEGYVSYGEIRPFTFSKLQVTDDDSANFHTTPNLGAISLSISRVIVGESEDYDPPPIEADAHDPVHERSKKGGSHIVAFAASEPYEEALCTWTTTPYSPEDEQAPYVVFIFRYRPLDLLQANDIAPRPSPNCNTDPVEQDGIIKIEDDDPVDDDEIRALEEKLNALKSRKRKIEQGGGASKRVKSEFNFSQHFISGEVIDLT